MSVILLFSVVTVLAECGQMRTFGMSQSALSGGSGSTAATSSAAKATWPLRSAATRAVSSTALPRPMLTKALPGLIAAIADASSRLRVSSVSGTVMTTGERAVQRCDAVDLVEERGVRSRLLRRAGHRDDAHIERAADPGDAAREIPGADDDERPPRHLLVAIANPAMRALLGLEKAQLAEMHEQRHEGELGERAGMDAARRRHDDIRPIEP